MPTAIRAEGTAGGGGPSRQDEREIVVEARNLSKIYRDFWGRSKKVSLKPLDL